MCGICALISQKEVSAKLYAGLKKLEYRGYDSCGMFTWDNQQTHLKKGVGSIAENNQKHNFAAMPGNIGIAHTRWATHGKVSLANAHPFVSNDGNVVIVHNGVIDNYQTLKKQLLEKNYVFHSETDSEVVANLLQEQITQDRQAGQHSIAESFRRTLCQLDGCYAILMFAKQEPSKIFGAKYLLPLIIGIADDTTYVSSDVSSFIEHTKTVLFLEENEMFVLEHNKICLFCIPSNTAIERKSVTLDWQEDTAEKGGYDHYMLKEIFEQPETITRVFGVEQANLSKVTDHFHTHDHNFLIGVGTTYYVALAGSYFFNQYAGRFVPAFSSDELQAQLTTASPAHSLFISQSGETYDTKEALRFVQQKQHTTSAIINNPASSIARMADNTIFQKSGPEICVVSTKASVAQLVLLMRLAMSLGCKNGTQAPHAAEQLDKRIKDFAAGLKENLNKQLTTVQSYAKQLAQHTSILCLGKGLYYPIALEAALKIKEVSYVHAEGMSTGFLKHGTLALIDKQIPCLFFVPPKEEKKAFDSTHSAIEEVKARGGVVFGFVPSDAVELHGLVDYPISIDIDNVPPSLYTVYQLILSQLLAYYIALQLNRPIDQPRNLAKSVTVP